MSNQSVDWRQAARAILCLTAIGVACAGPEAATAVRSRLVGPQNASDIGNPNSAAGDEKGIIHGWLEGETVSLRYSKRYFCAEPPTSAVSTGCEVGAAATVAPRSGPIPKVYALAPVGFAPDP